MCRRYVEQAVCREVETYLTVKSQIEFQGDRGYEIQTLLPGTGVHKQSMIAKGRTLYPMECAVHISRHQLIECSSSSFFVTQHFPQLGASFL